ncbi:hypothetical protein [Pseudomonas putida]|uniref:Heme-binding protein n=1 Tax=Pseudomonas putida (strain DOT-T1E) TaxID=1196325 RepID=I7CCK6_PSEPT|nr:hypothetical protein [Pseudomonas putida]AFO49634.1 hypothetical protein T1E_3804 [Pseudomonas putida DOT-T1E]
MTTLNFELAVQLAVATLHQARALNLKPMAAAVLDSAGHPLSLVSRLARAAAPTL